MSEKKISIIIPCYNVEKYIDRCFEGLVSQTLGIDNMEIIIVDDASSDDTLIKIKEYEEKYSESVIMIPLEENVGQGAARNIAMNYASAPYVGFVDADDSIAPDMFKTMLSVIEEHGCDFVECDWDFFSEDKTGYTPSSFELGTSGCYDFSQREVKDDYISKQLFFTSVWNKVFSRPFLVDNEIIFPEGVRYEDMYFCFLAILYAESYYYVGQSFYHYYLNPKGTVQQRNSAHQLDMMDVSCAFLQSAHERGLYDKYKDEIEWMFMEKYYVYMIWDIWDLYKEQAYEFYQEMKKVVTTLVPDYRANPFRMLPENRMDDVILKLLDYPLDKKQFEDMMDKMWKQQHGG